MKWRLPVLSLTCLLSAPSVLADTTVLGNEAGFMPMAPATFYYHYGSYPSRLELTSSAARIWYSFRAADGDASRKPLFVFFNGGPGSATSAGLMSMYTSRVTLDNQIDSGGGAFIPNPVPWTRLGNLLYVDARQAGFSYSVSDRAADGNARFQEFNAQNFGTFVDGADFVRLLLRFLARHPDLQDNPVVIVGESYGGTRATVILHLLLKYADYGNGVEMFQDAALAAEIQAHLDVVFPAYRGRRVPSEIVAGQFGHQILIQPTLSMGYQVSEAEEMWRQPGSVLYQIGREVGIPYDPRSFPYPYHYVDSVAGRDLYMYTKPREWLNGFFDNAGRLLRFSRNLSLMTGTDVTGIPELRAAQRSTAYRVADPASFDESQALALGTSLDVLQFLAPARREVQQPEPGDLQTVFGALRPWDRYFMTSNWNANWAFYFFNVARLGGYEIDYSAPRFGRMFLENVIHVRTFVTNAALDLVVYSEAVPPALARHTEILTSVRHERNAPGGADRPGQLVLNYRPDAYPGVSPAGARTIRFPLYAKSGHAVSLTQPEDLFADVARWLSEDGVAVDQGTLP